MKRTIEGFFDIKDFKVILAKILEERSSRRKNYSMRAFARDLGIRQSTLSGVMRGAHGMSSQMARDISKELGFTKREADYFVALVESRHSRSKLVQDQARAKLDSLKSSRPTAKIERETKHFLSAWYYPAALELVTISGPKVTAATIAKKLRISVKQSEQALAVLLQLGLIRKTESNEFVRVQEHLAAVGTTPSATLRGFHKQILEQGKAAIEDQPIEQRKFLSATFSFDSRKMEQARAWLDDMYENFLNQFAAGGTSDSVNAVGIQFFRLDSGGAQ